MRHYRECDVGLKRIHYTHSGGGILHNDASKKLTGIQIVVHNICPSSPDILLVFGHNSANFWSSIKNKSILETLKSAKSIGTTTVYQGV